MTMDDAVTHRHCAIAIPANYYSLARFPCHSLQVCLRDALIESERNDDVRYQLIAWNAESNRDGSTARIFRDAAMFDPCGPRKLCGLRMTFQLFVS